MSAEDLLKGIRVVPVVVVDSVADAIPLAETLLANDIRAIEVTLRTPEAIDVIRDGQPVQLYVERGPIGVSGGGRSIRRRR